MLKICGIVRHASCLPASLCMRFSLEGLTFDSPMPPPGCLFGFPYGRGSSVADVAGVS